MHQRASGSDPWQIREEGGDLGSVGDERMRRREGGWICPFSNLTNTLDHSFREKRALGAGSREGFDGGKGNDTLAVGRKRERNKQQAHMATLLF